MSMTPLTHERAHALAASYAARGWSVFPCVVGGKTPRTRSGFKAGTTSYDQIRTWWGREPYNIGIWTGQSRLVVLDCDLKLPTKRWRVDEFSEYREVQDHDAPIIRSGLTTWLDILAGRGLDEAPTYTVITPSYGVHFYFEDDSEGRIHPAVEWRPGIDIRAAGSYVVAAGSETDVGSYDQDLEQPWEPAPLPSWLRDVLVEETKPGSGLGPAEDDGSVYSIWAKKGRNLE